MLLLNGFQWTDNIKLQFNPYRSLRSLLLLWNNGHLLSSFPTSNQESLYPWAFTNNLIFIMKIILQNKALVIPRSAIITWFLHLWQSIRFLISLFTTCCRPKRKLTFDFFTESYVSFWTSFMPQLISVFLSCLKIWKIV